MRQLELERQPDRQEKESDLRVASAQVRSLWNQERGQVSVARQAARWRMLACSSRCQLTARTGDAPVSHSRRRSRSRRCQEFPATMPQLQSGSHC